MRENDVDLQADQFGCDLGEALAFSVRPPNLYRDVATFDPTKLTQPPDEHGEALAVRRRGGRAQEPDGRQPLRLLRARRERPRRRAAEPPSRVMNARRLMLCIP
jgi:hypothetical protein